MLKVDQFMMSTRILLSLLFIMADQVQGFEPTITFSPEKVIAFSGQSVMVTATVSSEKAISQLEWEIFSASSNMQQLYLVLVCNTNQSKSLVTGHHSTVASLQTSNCKTGNSSLRIPSVPVTFNGILTLKLVFTGNLTSAFSAGMTVELQKDKIMVKRQSDSDPTPPTVAGSGISSSVIAGIVLFVFAVCLILFYCYIYRKIESGQKSHDRIRSGEFEIEDDEEEEEEEEREQGEEGEQDGLIPKSRLDIDAIPDKAVSSTSDIYSQKDFSSRQNFKESVSAVSQRKEGKRAGQKVAHQKDKDKSYVTLLFEGKPALRIQQDKKRSIVFNINKTKSTAIDHAPSVGTSVDHRKSNLKVQKNKKPQTAYKFSKEKNATSTKQKSSMYLEPKSLRSVAQQSSIYKEPKHSRSAAQKSSRYLEPKMPTRENSSGVDSPKSSKSLGQYLIFNIFQRGSSTTNRPKDAQGSAVTMTMGGSSVSGHRAEVRRSSRLLDSALNIFRPNSRSGRPQSNQTIVSTRSRRQKENPKHKKLYTTKKK